MDYLNASTSELLARISSLEAELASLRALDPVRLEAAVREGHDATWGGCRYKDLPESFKESIRVRMRAAILTYLGKTEGE